VILKTQKVNLSNGKCGIYFLVSFSFYPSNDDLNIGGENRLYIYYINFILLLLLLN